MKQSKKLTRAQKIEITKSLIKRHDGLKQDEALVRLKEMTPKQRNKHLAQNK